MLPAISRSAFDVIFRYAAIFGEINAKQQRCRWYGMLGVSKPTAWDEPEGDQLAALNSQNPYII